MSGIEAIIYDFGGVVVDWNPRNLYRQLFDDPDEMERFLRDVWSPAENDRCDRGRPFAEMVVELSGRHPEYADRIAACAPGARWIEMISGPIAGAREVIDELRATGYRLYGLSNWSAETFPLTRARYDVFDCFEDLLISGELDGIAKPDREMFELLASRNRISPQTSVFIDDSPRNVDAAISFGYHGVHFTDTDALRDELRALGVEVGSTRSQTPR